MAETQREPVVGRERDLQVIYSRTEPAEARGEVLELLFLLRGEDFEAALRQRYSDRNLHLHNPGLPSE
jgi:hypothetical protein